MKFLIAALMLVFSLAVTAQKGVALVDLKAHIGDTITTCGTVSGAYYAIRAKNSPTFLNLGGKYPNQLMTVVIWEDARSKFHVKPEDAFAGKQVCISGKVELFESKPQITVYEPKQLWVVKE